MIKNCRQIDKSKLCVHGFPVFPQPFADFRFKKHFFSARNTKIITVPRKKKEEEK